MSLNLMVFSGKKSSIWSRFFAEMIFPLKTSCKRCVCVSGRQPTTMISPARCLYFSSNKNELSEVYLVTPHVINSIYAAFLGLLTMV